MQLDPLLSDRCYQTGVFRQVYIYHSYFLHNVVFPSEDVDVIEVGDSTIIISNIETLITSISSLGNTTFWRRSMNLNNTFYVTLYVALTNCKYVCE